MKRVMVLLSFIQLQIALKILFYKNVILNMTGNVLFEEPDVPLVDLTTAVTKLEGHYNKSRSGDHEEMILMRQCMEETDGKFRLTARYVDRIANGNEAVIESAGFEASKQPDPRRTPLFAAYNGEIPSQIILRCKVVKGAKSYIWQFAEGAIPANEEDWVYAGFSTQSTFTIDNLKSFTKYWFRYCAVKSEGMTAWSEPIMKVVI